MRGLSLVILLAVGVVPASAGDISVEVHSARPFGYFVGDLIHAEVEIRAPAGAVLSPATLPHPGTLSASLDLRNIYVEQARTNDGAVWRLDLTYQNFYVALDVRDVQIPAFTLTITTPSGVESHEVPVWRIGVAPLREVAPEKRENAEDYMRPDTAPITFSETRPQAAFAAFSTTALLGLVLIARDRAWPPFHMRRRRLFSALARRIRALTRVPENRQTVCAALMDIHRTLDACRGKSLLQEDLPTLLHAHPEFADLESSLNRFFSASRRLFFGRPEDTEAIDVTVGELARLSESLARRERVG
ncbi:hypothetical protein [Methylocapsa palsarum]|uniref:MxaA protein n=1 Tax=Methylocapsa palsarum TaxID=1612308 RepID=A0A1I4AYU5_9HYPH|nr:hypothetical protein [Methylocapsa palsarum]SFK61021.1 mxaA protein [Methylocapsa palsarum]